jgi:hypothetical protein
MCNRTPGSFRPKIWFLLLQAYAYNMLILIYKYRFMEVSDRFGDYRFVPSAL